MSAQTDGVERRSIGQSSADGEGTRQSPIDIGAAVNGVAGDLIDRMMGHAGRTVRQRRYTAGDLEAMLRAVETIKLDLAPKEGEVRGLVSLASGTPANDQPCTLPAGRRLLRPPNSIRKNRHLPP